MTDFELFILVSGLVIISVYVNIVTFLIRDYKSRK